ncbi:MAG: hypothetical protein PHO07_11120 [Pirellulales bacterium]|jgi:DNA-binding phage protein|nr:hypothetical protein [Thermoguttaceae bacterium]MDD4787717.1 hypothetical protein [Pirellulales bacterium]NLZ00936.1 hypothetical protein [Pirellulaceae bacterium]
MMAMGGFSGRSSELEEKFFRERDMQLLEALREKTAAAERRKALAEASGITHDGLLEKLETLGLTGQTLAALLLAPLIEVAWADGTLHEKERLAVMGALRQKGIDSQHPAYQLLEDWLRRKPDPQLLEVWKEYVASLAEVLGEEERKELRDDLLQRAREVAEAAGGFFGFGGKISKREQELLDALAAAFD